MAAIFLRKRAPLVLLVAAVGVPACLVSPFEASVPGVEMRLSDEALGSCSSQTFCSPHSGKHAAHFAGVSEYVI